LVDGELADLPGHAAADLNRYDPAAVEADAAAVEQERRRRLAVVAAAQPAPAEVAAGAAAAEIEDAAAFKEEVALLRKEQVEARQVELLLIDLDLREVGVVGEVGHQVGGDAVLHVAAGLEVEIVRERRRAQPVGGGAAEGVGLDLEGAAGRRSVDAGGAAVERGAIEAHRPAHRRRECREVGPFVLAADRAPYLEAPGLVLAAGEAQRLERNDHLHRPAAREAAGAHVPHRVPVGVGLSFVDDRVVGERR
jgi:hypothetical protein